jgi:hypothetical protein
MSIPQLAENVLVQIELAGWGTSSSKLKGQFRSSSSTNRNTEEVRLTPSGSWYIDHCQTPLLRRKRGFQFRSGGRGIPSICTYKVGRDWKDSLAIRSAEDGKLQLLGESED